MSGLICAGDVYLDLYVNSALTGMVGPINATKFAISPGTAEKIDRISYLRDTFGQALDSVVFPGVASLSIDTDGISWRVEADPLISRGGCIVETETSRIDATVESRIAAIASKMFGGERESDRGAA